MLRTVQNPPGALPELSEEPPRRVPLSVEPFWTGGPDGVSAQKAKNLADKNGILSYNIVVQTTFFAILKFSSKTANFGYFTINIVVEKKGVYWALDGGPL